MLEVSNHIFSTLLINIIQHKLIIKYFYFYLEGSRFQNVRKSWTLTIDCWGTI